MREYDELFDWYVDARSADAGMPDLEAFVRELAPGARVLDLGCGHGLPIAQFLTRRGFDLFALDSSPKMIAHFRATFADVPVQCARIQDSDFFNTSFDAIIAWGVLFHMVPADQAVALARIAAALNPGGRLLFTAQEAHIDGYSTMNGLRVPYISLGSAEYTRLLHEHGLTLRDAHVDAWDNYVYTAEKPLPALGG
jgi:cyclopropane fatty-acyl-phospholipid synthase-like methyltransferase